MLNLVFSMDALGAFPIACRRQWRTPNTRVRTNAGGAPNGEHVPPVLQY